jgi:hypothetical protein
MSALSMVNAISVVALSGVPAVFTAAVSFATFVIYAQVAYYGNKLYTLEHFILVPGVPASLVTAIVVPQYAAMTEGV